MTPLRAFLRTFREALARASFGVGPVQVCLDAQRERAEPRIKAGHIAVPRLTSVRGVLRSENERGAK